MTLTIEIKPEIEDILRRRGMTDGQELWDYVEHLIEEDNKEGQIALAAKGHGTSIVEKTYGSAGIVDRKDLIAFAEDEEFSGY